MHERGASAPINGRDGCVVEQVGFGFLERGVAAGGIELGVGGVDERVVGGVGPAGAVDAVARGKNGEVGERVGIFGGPFAAGEGVVAGLVVDGGEEHFEFFLEDHDLDAEFAAPAFLEGFGDALVGLLGDGEKLDFGETDAAGIAGFGEELAGERGVGGEAGRREVAGDVGRGEGRGGELATAEDVFDDGFAVDREGEGASDAGVAEGGGGDVEAQKVAVEDGFDAEERGGVGFIGVDFAEGHVPGRVELAGAEGEFLALEGFAGVEADLVEANLRGVPVMGIFFYGEVLALAPFAEAERAVADERSGARPAGAAVIEGAGFFHGSGVDGEPGVGAQQREKVGGRLRERDLERGGVEGAEADLSEVGELALGVGLGVFDGVKNVFVFGGEGGRERAAETVEKITRGERVAVGPTGGGA